MTITQSDTKLTSNEDYGDIQILFVCLSPTEVCMLFSHYYIRK